jgi:hypothetical protein
VAKRKYSMHNHTYPGDSSPAGARVGNQVGHSRAEELHKAAAGEGSRAGKKQPGRKRAGHKQAGPAEGIEEAGMRNSPYLATLWIVGEREWREGRKEVEEEEEKGKMDESGMKRREERKMIADSRREGKRREKTACKDSQDPFAHFLRFFFSQLSLPNPFSLT